MRHSLIRKIVSFIVRLWEPQREAQQLLREPSQQRHLLHHRQRAHAHRAGRLHRQPQHHRLRQQQHVHLHLLLVRPSLLLLRTNDRQL